jgi:dTMP kinase
MRRGSLIVIEGLDRTGKTTQTERLLAKLASIGVNHKLVKFPQRETEIGIMINKYLTDKTFQLKDQAAHLLFSANRWELVNSIEEDLKNGVTVVLDRYVYSGVAYSAAKGLDFDWCLNPDKGLPKPDVTVFLKFKDDGEHTSREGFGDERYEVAEFQAKVRKMFEKFQGNEEWNVLYVDGMKIEEVEEKIWNIVMPYSKGIEETLNVF